MAREKCVGIDFGTSNSAVALSTNGKVRLIEAELGKFTQPSSIFIRADGYISTGSQAVGDFQSESRNNDGYHFIPSVKPGLSLRGYDGNVVRSTRRLENGRPITRFFPVEELGGALIGKLKRRAEETIGSQVSSVILGRPVFFSTDTELDRLAQLRLENAAKHAGFKHTRFVMEPVAAAMYYERVTQRRQSQKVLVFDFGGGTLDISIINLPESQVNLNRDSTSLAKTVIATNGISLGGTDLDKDIFRSLFPEYFGFNVSYTEQGLTIPRYIELDVTEWHLKEILHQEMVFDFLGRVASDLYCTDPQAIKRLMTLIRYQQMYPLLRNIETAKINLSDHGRSTITHRFNDIDIDVELTTRQYEHMIRARVRSIRDCLFESLRMAGITQQDIDVVLKVGGSSSNRFVDGLLTSIFKGKINSLELFTSVVSGLAIVGNNQ